MTKDEFGRRVVAAQDRLYRIARSYLRNEHDCLDAVSEAILKAWQKQNTLRDEQAFDTWLNRIVIRECVNIQRRQKRFFPVETPPDSPANPTTLGTDLSAVIDCLPQSQRIVVVLHYMEGYGMKEMAWQLNCTPGTVASRLHYARIKLRDLLKEEIE